jgi:hypothetical protein
MITVKLVFPVPIMEELLDELGQASWFCSLDLTVVYHQILLQPAKTHRTTFQTNMSHYEFRVMAFGLTGAHATFQKVMDVIYSRTADKTPIGHGFLYEPVLVDTDTGSI